MSEYTNCNSVPEAAKNESAHVTQRLDALLSGFAEQEPLAGLALGIVHGGLNYARGFGVSNVETGQRVDENTLFHMASVSKTLVGTGIMQLAEQGRLNLDDPAVKHVPYFRLADGREQEVTIRDLLSHTSGMPDEDDFHWEHPEYDEGSLERYIRGISDRSLERNPGEAHAYSNMGFELLGDIIAKTSGIPFESFMEKYVLQPAGMADSTFLIQNASPEKLAAPHILGVNSGYGPHVSPVFPYHRAHGPSSTLYTSAEDSCRYMREQLQSSRGGLGGKLLGPESYDAMWSTRAHTGYGDWLDGIGLGWFTGSYRGKRAVSHTGQDTGFRSYLVLLPDEEIGVTLMMNNDYVGLKILCKAILDVLLDEPVQGVKRSMAHYLSGVALSEGNEAVWSEYERIRDSEQERYLISDEDFNSIASILMGNGHRQEASSILEFALRVFPESSTLQHRWGEIGIVEDNL